MFYTFPVPENLSFVKSPNDKQILIYKERKNQQIEAICFTPGVGVLWTHTLPLGDDKSRREIIDVEITDAGDLYLLGTGVDGDSALDPFIYFYSNAGKKGKRLPISSESDVDHWGYCLRFINDGTPVVAGLYKKEKTKQAGYRLFKIDTKAQTMQLFATGLFPERYKEVTYEGAYRPKYYRVVEILQLENGSITFSIEGRAIKSGKSIYSVYTSPAFVACVDPQGKEQWSTIIDKYQAQVQSPLLTGHCLVSKGNSVFMLFNDDFDNFDRPLTHKADEGLLKKKMYVALVEIDPSGVAKKLPFISATKDDISVFTPMQIKRISRNVFQFTFQVGDQYKYATLEANGNLGVPELYVNDGHIRYVPAP